MQLAYGQHETHGTEVLVSCVATPAPASWVQVVDDLLRPDGFLVWRAWSEDAAIERVERGGLAAAVLAGTEQGRDAISLLRIIRSIDRALPCWLVTTDATRQTLEAALDLRAVSVIHGPVEPHSLTVTLKRTLMDAKRNPKS